MVAYLMNKNVSLYFILKHHMRKSRALSVSMAIERVIRRFGLTEVPTKLRTT